MRRVEFRLVQVVLSVIGDDRVTVGLLHWDGERCRAAINATRIPPGAEVRRGIGAIRAALKHVARSFLRTTGSAGLAERFPVTVGLGSAYPYWTHVRVGQTRNPEAHFEELRRHFRLKEVIPPRARKAGPRGATRSPEGGGSGA